MILPAMTQYLRVTVVIPCRNESAHIRQCLDSLLASDYPKDKLEILVVDGLSEDGTRNIVLEYERRYPFVRLLDNPKCFTPAAMNIGISNAKGDAIAIVGAHATYDKQYLSECVKHLGEYRADVAGAAATYVPREATPIGKAISIALAHPFGAGANVKFKTGATGPVWVDTVSSGCFRRDVFDRVGLFNEELLHSQDIEFNLRVARAGSKILLVPTAKIQYFARSGFWPFCKHNFRNGLWAILPFLYSTNWPMRLRHLVPLLFVMSLLVLGLMATGTIWPVWPFVMIVSAYLSLSFFAAIHISWREQTPSYFLLMPLVFGALHLGYGLGSLWGVLRLLASRRFWRRLYFPHRLIRRGGEYTVKNGAS